VYNKFKGDCMAEKRIKTKRLYVRLTDEIYEALDKYSKQNKVTKTKIIEDYLKRLLIKDK
jgi:predicted DNA-binding protein